MINKKVELVELYLPDCLKHWAEIVAELPKSSKMTKLNGFNFVLKFATQATWTLNVEKTLSQYFFDDAEQNISAGELCAYFCDLGEGYYWIKADPVQYILDRNQGFIVPNKPIGSDFNKLIKSINLFLKQDELELIIINTENWLIRSQKPIKYVSPSLLNVVNQPIQFEHISGDDKIFWQKLSAELQLLCRQYKQDRIEEDNPDGVYFWGAGELPKNKINNKMRNFNKIISNDYSALGLAKWLNIEYEQVVLPGAERINVDVQKKNSLYATQDFSLYSRIGDRQALLKLSVYFDGLLLQYIDLIKQNKLATLVLNTGDKTYQITKKHIIQSYFLRFFS